MFLRVSRLATSRGICENLNSNLMYKMAYTSPIDDYCRVVLSDPNGTDYINAAFIDVRK